jgi:hypothetical protein
MADSAIPSGLADRLARSVAELAGPVPVDLHSLATSLGVTEIVPASMTEDGRTTWDEGRPRIELRADRPQTRRRFTLAHEIGHILLAQDQSVARRTHGLANDDVERLCERIAASILMPRDWVYRFTERERYNLSVLRLMAHKADVSLAAAAVRLAEVSGGTCVLLRWKRAPTRWVIVGQAAVPLQYSGRLEATTRTSEEFDRLPSRRDRWRDLTLKAGDACLNVEAHVDRSGETCMTLLTSIRESQAE